MGRTIGLTWSAAAVTSSRTDPERGMRMLRNVDWTRSPEGPRSVLTVLLALSGLVYFGVVTLTSVLAPYRFAISYAVFCLKKKKKQITLPRRHQPTSRHDDTCRGHH